VAGANGPWQGEQVDETPTQDRRRQPLSLERIVTAALELIDEQGIGMASMRTVGTRLGVRAMSLYRYVDSREDLFDAVVERIVSELDDDPEAPEKPTDGWRPYLAGLARGVRRYAIAHPHAFPLVATRPSASPWVNPPLRSLRWIEALLTALRGENFSDDEVLFAYRSFNSYLLGFLLLETSALALHDPKPGDGSFQSGDAPGGTDPIDPADPVPGGLSPTRPAEHREALAGASTAREVVDPVGDVDRRTFPVIHDLREGLAASYYEDEFEAGLSAVLDRIAQRLAAGSSPA
jgi:TetR/AcrR family tetracycline transcriptional repressor